ncbi:MAG TPA: hypothetical protein VJT31_15610, partial [Rugosimonospora sp.]|nr:hypothetical protein [Rugosimonospora sp.]
MGSNNRERRQAKQKARQQRHRARAAEWGRPDPAVRVARALTDAVHALHAGDHAAAGRYCAALAD